MHNNVAVQKEAVSYGRLLDAFNEHPKLSYLNKEEVELRKEEALQKANSDNGSAVQYIYKMLCPHFLKFTLLMPAGFLLGIFTGSSAFFALTVFFFALSAICFAVDCRMHRWHRTLLLNYRGYVPSEGRQKSLAIMSRVHDCLVFVDHIGTDPFLVAVILDGHGVIEEEVFFCVWDIYPMLSTVK